MKENLPKNWGKATSAMQDVISCYQRFIFSVTELCDLIEWDYEYMFSRLMPIRKWDRLRTNHFKEVFAALDLDMKESMFAAEKRSKALEKKRELMEKFGITEEEIDEMLTTLNT